MFIAEYDGINSFLTEISKVFLNSRVPRVVRGYHCWELQEPIMIKITNPRSRWVTIPIREWNFFLPYAESLWLALGHNDLKMIQHYLPKMADFSDDGEYLRGGYGPRLRHFNGNRVDYRYSWNKKGIPYHRKVVDQYAYIIDCFKKDKYTRQAIISIGDPPKDCFDKDGALKRTKDFPCTQSLQFITDSASNKLNLIVSMRSNDFIWGASAVNIFNFTFIQEYLAHILKLEIGSYFHIVNNFHYYERHEPLIHALATQTNIVDDSFQYQFKFNDLHEFDSLIQGLGAWEENLRKKKTDKLADFHDDFLNDWAKVFYFKRFKTKVDCSNPILNSLMDAHLKKTIE